jgi:hypothetical protein
LKVFVEVKENQLISATVLAKRMWHKMLSYTIRVYSFWHTKEKIRSETRFKKKLGDVEI